MQWHGMQAASAWATVAAVQWARNASAIALHCSHGNENTQYCCNNTIMRSA
jgi:hypothetical protein